MDVVTKKAFAESVGVTASAVSHWIGTKKLHGPALVGRGCRARINAPVALEQLRRNLDVSQRTGGNARAKLNKKPAGAVLGAAAITNAPIPETRATDARSDEGDLQEQIKAARLQQLELLNAKAREEAAQRAGRYVRSDEARAELGRVSSRLLSLFDGSLTEFADAIAAQPADLSREILRTLRATWREIRTRQAKTIGTEAAALARLIEEEEDGAAL